MAGPFCLLLLLNQGTECLFHAKGPHRVRYGILGVWISSIQQALAAPDNAYSPNRNADLGFRSGGAGQGPFQFSLRARCTAIAAGFLTLIHDE